MNWGKATIAPDYNYQEDHQGTDAPRGLKSRAAQANVLRQFKALVASLGGDAADLLRQSPSEPCVLDAGDGLIPSPLWGQLLERASAELGCRDFGMRLAAAQATQHEATFPSSSGTGLRAVPTPDQVLRHCADHVHSQSPVTKLRFETLPSERTVSLMLEVPAQAPARQRQEVEHAMLLARHAIHAFSGGRVRAREVRLAHEPLAEISTYRNNFNATLRFGERMNGLFFDEQDFAGPAPGVPPGMAPRMAPRIAIEQRETDSNAIDERFHAAATTLSTRVRSMIARLLLEGDCTYERIASAFGVHPRTLQRRLKKEGESFESIKDSVRRDVALRYLQQPNFSLVQVTEILGYSETSVLSRSCRRWFAASPRELRNKLNQPEARLRVTGS